MLRRILLAAALLASLVAPAIAQPAPVPALPDTERRTSYSITATTCACAVNFALYGDSTDYQNWVEVWLNGVNVAFNDLTFGWTITSPSGPLGSIARPVTDAVLTFNAVQTGTVQIVGARRPRRTSQFSENRGVDARSLNQVFTDLVAQNRETWDRGNDLTGRTIRTQPGNQMGQLPLPTACQGAFLGFDGTGLNPTCSTPPLGSGNVVGLGPSVVGDLAVWANTAATSLGDTSLIHVAGTTVSIGGVAQFASLWGYADLRQYASLSCNPGTPSSTNVGSAFTAAAAAGLTKFFIPSGCFWDISGETTPTIPDGYRILGENNLTSGGSAGTTKSLLFGGHNYLDNIFYVSSDCFNLNAGSPGHPAMCPIGHVEAPGSGTSPLIAYPFQSFLINGAAAPQTIPAFGGNPAVSGWVDFPSIAINNGSNADAIFIQMSPPNGGIGAGAFNAINIYGATTGATGNGIQMNFGAAGGSFTGNFINALLNGALAFTVDYLGDMHLAGTQNGNMTLQVFNRSTGASATSTLELATGTANRFIDLVMNDTNGQFSINAGSATASMSIFGRMFITVSGG